MPKAQFLGTYRGRRVHRYPVRATVPVDLFSTRVVFDDSIAAYSQSDAARYVKREFSTVPNLNIDVFGPKGGRRSFFQGWFTATGNALSVGEWRQTELLDVAIRASILHGIG